MKPLIECCEQNLSKGSQLLADDLFIQENSDMITYSCMNECQLCAQTFYALFEGELVSAESEEELKMKLIQKIQLWQQEFMME